MAPKKQKQPKVVVPEPLFHESLGRDLADKFMAILDQQDYHKPLAKCVPDVKPEEPYIIRRYSGESRTSSDSTLHEIVLSATDIATATSKIMITKEKDIDHKRQPKRRTEYKLDDLTSASTIEALVNDYGRMTHMGVRDHSYHFFLNPSRTGAISYRLCGKVAVISGDPICPVSQYRSLLHEFSRFCKSNGWKYAMNGTSQDMAAIANELSWSTIAIAKERVINAQTNPVLLGSEGKRIRTQCKQLMKSGTQVNIYSPPHQRDMAIERQIAQLYEDWRADRNSTSGPQAYVTVFDVFTLARLMTFLYTTDSTGAITGFAALRKLKNGYHIDPCIAIPTAPRGTVDLLLMSTMALLKEAGATRLCLGVEPLEEIGEVTGMSKTLERLTRKSHKMVTAELPLGGKKGFNDRFRPDDDLEEMLYLVYPNNPSIRQQVAMAHFSNVQLHKALKQRGAREFGEFAGRWKRKDLSVAAVPSLEVPVVAEVQASA